MKGKIKVRRSCRNTVPYWGTYFSYWSKI